MTAFGDVVYPLLSGPFAGTLLDTKLYMIFLRFSSPVNDFEGNDIIVSLAIGRCGSKS